MALLVNASGQLLAMPGGGVATVASAIKVTPSLPDAYVGSSYAGVLNGTGGNNLYTWTVTGAPSWMTVITTGVGAGSLTGTPTAAGNVVLSCQATDGSTPANVSDVVNVTIVVRPAGQIWFGAQLPNAAQTFTTTSSPPTPANTNRGSYYTPGVAPDASLDLQTAINNAAAATGNKGDVIVLQAGTTYTATSTFNLPTRAGSGTIYVIGNTAPEIGGTGLPAAGTRVGRATIPNMPALRTSSTSAPIIGRAGAIAGVSNYRFVGLDIELQEGQGTGGYAILFFNYDSSVSTLIQHITFDRCYVAGAPTNGVNHTMCIDGLYMEVTECCLERGYYSGNADNQAIYVLGAGGPFKMHNNYLEAGGQTFFIGGAASSMPPIVQPTDIVFTNNHTRKPNFSAAGSFAAGSNVMTITSVTTGEIVPSVNVYSAGGALTGNNVIVKQLTGSFGQAGTYQLNNNAANTVSGDTITGFIWQNGKNNFEFKIGTRVLLDSNFFENAFAGGQAKSALVFTVRNTSAFNPWFNVGDVTVTNNVFTNCYNGGMQYEFCDSTAPPGGAHPSQPGFRFLIRNNIFMFSRNASDSGTVVAQFNSLQAPTGGNTGYGGDLIWDHNTFVGPGNSPAALWGCFSVGGDAAHNQQFSTMVWSNNIWDASSYGVSAKGLSTGYNWSSHVPPQVASPVFVANVVTGVSDGTIPAGNYYPANAAAIGFTSYGSITAATGYSLTTGSTYHALGVSGAGLAANGTPVPDSSDLGCNISLLPTS